MQTRFFSSVFPNVRRICFFLIQCIGFSVAIHCDVCAESHGDVFPSDAIASWREVQREICKGSMVDTYTKKIGHEKITPRKVVFYEGSELTIYNAVELRAKNKRYSFTLKRGSKVDNWELNDIADNSSIYLDDSTGILLSAHDVFEGIMMENHWLENLVLSKDFRILKTENVASNDGKELLSITFQCSYDLDTENTIHGGTLTCVPSNHWTLVQYDITGVSKIKKNGKIVSEVKGRIKKTFEYQELNGLPFPKKVICESSAEGYASSQIETTYSNVSTTIDPNVFFLSHYGFFEPENPQRRLVVVRIMLMTAGVLLILFGLYLRWFATKKK